MRFSFAALAAVAALSQSALAHYRWTSLIVNGVTTNTYQYVRQNTNYNSPVTDLSSDDLRCNVGGLASGPATSIATVAAGATVGFALDQAIYHPGPINVYMSKSTVANVSNYDGSGPWFKISDQGATYSSAAINFLSENIVSYSFAIPKATPPGQYLLRIEQIALHTASTVGGAQFYISCAQITVTGSGTGTPTPTISFPGGYLTTDPGILINIWYPIPTSYAIPGPAVWS